MSRYTKEDLMRLVEEEGVEFIRLQFTDLFGTLKNMAVTASQLERVCNRQCMFDGSLIDGFVKMEEDLCLYPDLDTFQIFPWRPQQGKVARLICDVYLPCGDPFEGDPRFILKRVLKEAADMGYTFYVGSECEFFLFHTDDNGLPTTTTHEKAGYFDLGPLDLGENARRDIVLSLEDMGFIVESSHHEAAPAQHEIDFRYDKALNAADNIMTFKLAVRSIAKRHGLHATFMPKPVFGINGSGMHTNMSLVKDGKNVFADQEDMYGLSTTAYQFIAGLLAHMRGMMLITNPIVNSYKRLVSGFEAPSKIAWSVSDRSSFIRIPPTRGEGTRIELRCPDSACNPYLTLAVCLAAGLDGIKRELVLPNSIDKKGERIKKGIPADLGEAIAELEKDRLIREVLGKRVTEKYLEAKKAEWAQYRAQVTDWEIGEYLYRC